MIAAAINVDRLAAWFDGLLRGDLSFTATDSSFTTLLDKIAGRNVVDVRGVNIGIEIRMGVNYTEAVVNRGMSLEHYVAVTSANVGPEVTCGHSVWATDEDIALMAHTGVHTSFVPILSLTYYTHNSSSA